jgi:hypothetical protein
MKDEDYILTGYRKASHSIERSGRSVFRIHNETSTLNAPSFVAYPLTNGQKATSGRTCWELAFSSTPDILLQH